MKVGYPSQSAEKSKFAIYSLIHRDLAVILIKPIWTHQKMSLGRWHREKVLLNPLDRSDIHDMPTEGYRQAMKPQVETGFCAYLYLSFFDGNEVQFGENR